jgi:hypothetical protein
MGVFNELKGMASGPLGKALGLAGATASIGGALLFFGFFSRSALFGLVGVPTLSLDYIALIEWGARALVDSVSLIFLNWFRVGILVSCLILGILAIMTWDTDRVSRYCRSPKLCLITYAIAFLLAALHLISMIDAAKLSSNADRDEQFHSARSAIAKAHKISGWSYSAEAGALWQSTYRLGGLWRLLPPFLYAEHVQSTDSEATLGQPTRVSPQARARAEDLYGWLFMASGLAFLATSLLRRWRIWLRKTVDDLPLDQFADSLQDGLSRKRFALRRLEACRIALEPLVVLAVLLSALLVPTAHGSLAIPTIGFEEVIVTMRAGKPCDAFETTTPATSSSLACSEESLQEAAEALEIYTGALGEVLSIRSENNDNTEALASFRSTFNAALDSAIKSECDGPLVDLWLRRPHPAIYRQFPKVGDYFWEEWHRRVQSETPLRFGHILQYPRGESADVLSIFGTMVEKTPLSDGRWYLNELPRNCIDQVVVAPSLHRAKFKALAQRAKGHDVSSEDLFELGSIWQPAVLPAAVAKLNTATLDVPRLGPLISGFGTQVRIFREYEPTAAQALIEKLGKIARDSAIAFDLRSAALTSLSQAGGVAAARVLAETLEVLGPNAQDERLGPAITAAGYLLKDVNLAQKEWGGQADLKNIHDRLFAFVQSVASDQRVNASLRATACTAMHNSGHPEAAKTIVRTAEAGFREGNEIVVGSCVTSIGLANAQSGRDLLHHVILAEDNSPGNVRLKGASMTALYRMGFMDGNQIVNLFVRASSQDTKQTIALYLEDASSPEVARALMKCFRDSSLSWEDRGYCISGLRLIDVDDDGDLYVDEVRSAVEKNQDPRIADELCATMSEFNLRGALGYRSIIEENRCPSARHLPTDPGLRRIFYLQEIFADGSGEPTPNAMQLLLDQLQGAEGEESE